MVKLLDIKNTEPDVDLAFRKVSIIIDTQLILIELMSKTKPENEEIPYTKENQANIELPSKNARNCRGNYYNVFRE